MYTNSDMRAVETASRQNHHPLPAHLHVSAGKELGSLEKHMHTNPGETRFLNLLPTQATIRDPLPVTSFGIKACSGSKPSATDPLHPNSNEIRVRSGVAAGTPFFVKKGKAVIQDSIDICPAPGQAAAMHHTPNWWTPLRQS